jgi:hypothetical protein
MAGACNQRQVSSANATAAPTSTAFDPIEPAIPNNVIEPVPTHEYAFEENGNYGYISEVSEEERRHGRATGNVSLFAYRGRIGTTYHVSAVGEDGRTTLAYECGTPCVAIKRMVGSNVAARIPYEPRSIIGAVFTDAMAGQLRVTREPAVTRNNRAAAANWEEFQPDDQPEPSNSAD